MHSSKKKAIIPGCFGREFIIPWFFEFAFSKMFPIFLHVLNCTKDNTEHI